jgi:hypothetical protein
MSEILDIIETYFIENDWRYTKDVSDNRIFCGVNGKHASFRLFFYVNNKKESILVLTTIDTKIPENKRIVVAEYITRANYGLNMGGIPLVAHVIILL